jgi:hypothetical protein
MNREDLIDCIRKEIKRQAQDADQHFLAKPGKDPDTFHVMGLLDVHKLAEAIHGR